MKQLSVRVDFFSKESQLNHITLQNSPQFAAHFHGFCTLKKELDAWLEAYLNCEVLPLPNLNLDHLPEFTKKTLHKLTSIPFGETRTYGAIAPHAPRAVGRACAINPYPLLIPCHRVVAANSLGGFAFGLPLKQRLVTFETTGN